MTRQRRPPRRSPGSAQVGNCALRGFSLVELAIVLVVSAVLVGGLMVPLSAQVEQRRLADTQKQLEEIKAALMGFAAATGRLPCPASSSSNGIENFATTPLVGNASNGICSNFFDGFLPAATLGLTPVDSQGYALDAWGFAQNRIRYAVSNATINTQTNPFTKTDGMKNAGIGNVMNQTLLYVCSSSTGITASNCGSAGTVTLSDKAVVVIYSLGSNAASGAAGADEQANLDADKVFVSHPKAGTAGNQFDDLVTWLGPSLLLNRMVEAGQLP